MPELPCPNCGSDLTFLDQYQRYYCHRCGRYAPEGYGAQGAKRCPTCGGILSYVAQYDRFYCYRCNAYAPMETVQPVVAEATPQADTLPRGEPIPETKPAELATPAAAPAMPPVTESGPPAVAPGPAPQLETRVPPEAPPILPAIPEAVVTPAVPEPAPARREEPEEKPVESPYASMKPAVLRVKIFSLKKSELMDLCKVYDLEPTGTKEQLQERLLSYLRDLEAESVAEESPSVTAEEPAPVAPAVSEAKPEPTPEPISEEPTPAAATLPVAEESHEPSRPAAQETKAAVAPVVVVVPEVVPLVEAVPRVEHPCPTCGRELNYISQYGRWYCYFCQKYAPSAVSKNACPTCGNTLRWIDQYQRWWCDVCRKYAPSDLPRPASAVAAVAAMERAVQPATEVAAETRPAVAVAHSHRNPTSGVGLILFGIVLFAIYEALAVFPFVLGYASPVTLPADQAALLNFFAFLFVAGGAVIAVMALRHRE